MMMEMIKQRLNEGSSWVALAVVLSLLSQLLPSVEWLQTIVWLAALGSAVYGFMKPDVSAPVPEE